MSKSLRRFAAVAAVLVAGWAGSAAYAAPLNLIKMKPDIASDNISINYSFNSGTGVGNFQVSGGIAESIANLNGTTTGLTSGSFILNVNLQVTGTGASQTVTPINGSLSVTSVGHNWVSSSSFSKFGFTTNSLGSNNPSSQFFEFVFFPSTGELAAGSGTTSIGVILGAQVSPTYTINSAMFTNAFTTSTAGNGTSDTFPVPLPSAAVMGLSGLAALPLLRLRRKA